MPATRVFRSLVSAAFVLHLLLWLMPFAGEWWPETFGFPLAGLDGRGAVIGFHPVWFWCLLSGWLLILAGLYFYVAAARPAFIVLVFGSVALELGWGVRVLAPWDAALGTLTAVIDGAAMVMAYWPRVDAEFRRFR